jgi:DNA-binding MarR family transcriptional regulator
VIRERSTPDRRQVLCQITPAGLRLLAELDEPVDAANNLALGMLDDAEEELARGVARRRPRRL